MPSKVHADKELEAFDIIANAKTATSHKPSDDESVLRPEPYVEEEQIYSNEEIDKISEKCKRVCNSHKSDFDDLMKELKFSSIKIIDLWEHFDDRRWWNNSTPLMIACLEGGATLVKVLLHLGADVHATNDLNNTALMIAAEVGELDMLKDILGSFAYEQHDCLFCRGTKSESVVQEQQRAMLAMRNNYEQTALMLAIEDNRNEEATYLLSLDESQVEHKNKYGKMPLCVAIEGGNYVISKLIIDIMMKREPYEYTIKDKGEEVNEKHIKNIKVGFNQNTLLMYACMSKSEGHVQILTYLLEKVPGIDVNAKAKSGNTCFDWTLTSGNVAAMKAILEYPDPNAPAFDFNPHLQEKSLKVLCRNGDDEGVSFLLKHINALKISRDLKKKLVGDAWKYGMVRLATLHLMTNSNNHINGTYYDMLNCTLDDVFKDDTADVVAPNSAGNISGLRQKNKTLSTKEQSFLLSTRMLSSKTDDSLKLLVQCAALYNFHFDYFVKYLGTQKNSIAILNDYLPLFLKCLKIGMNKQNDMEPGMWEENQRVKENDTNDSLKRKAGVMGLRGMYSAQEVREMGLSYKFRYFPKHLTDVDAVRKIVKITLLLQEESSDLNEKIDTEAHLEQLQKMLLDIFNCAAFTSHKALQKFQDPHHFQHSLVRLAHVFQSGPVADLLDAKISSILNSGNISPIIDELFWGFLRNKHHYMGSEKRLPMLKLFRKQLWPLWILGFGEGDKLINLPSPKRNVAELTSNLINIRFNPASMFCLEGMSKALYLGLLVRQAIGRESILYFDYALVVMIVSTAINEFGEYQGDQFAPIFSKSLLRDYFSSKWNLLDMMGLLVSTAGIIIELRIPGSEYPKAFYAVAIIFVSLAMLRYICVYEPLGQLVEMVFAQLKDIVTFLLVFMLATFGFFIALYSLAHTQPSEQFRSKSVTLDTLFHSAFANYDSFDELFSDHDNPHRKLSMIIFMLYVFFSGVVLLNLVIARMSATHDKLDAVALEQWKFNTANIVKSYLLLNERNPCAMLPPPFNLLTVAISLFMSLPRFIYLKLITLNNEEKTLNDKKMIIVSSAGTFADFMLGFVMSFIAPLLEVGWCLYGISWRECIRLILCFPIIYPMYVFSLLLETTQLRTRINVSKQNLSNNYYEVVYHEALTPSPCVTVISNDTSDTAAAAIGKKSHISIKIVRIQVAALHDQNQVPIIEVRFQNIVSYLEKSILENGAFRFVDSTVTFPIDQLDFSKGTDLKLRFRVYNRNLITRHDDILSRVTIPSNIMRNWVANGRFEGPLPFNTTQSSELESWIKKKDPAPTDPEKLKRWNAQAAIDRKKDMIQIVFKTNIQKKDNIEALFHICEKEDRFSCKYKSNSNIMLAETESTDADDTDPESSSPLTDTFPQAELASMRCIKKRQENSLFTHAELQKIFVLEEDHSMDPIDDCKLETKEEIEEAEKREEIAEKQQNLHFTSTFRQSSIFLRL